MFRKVPFFLPDRLRLICESRHDGLLLIWGEKQEGGTLWKECLLQASVFLNNRTIRWHSTKIRATFSCGLLLDANNRVSLKFNVRINISNAWHRINDTAVSCVTGEKTRQKNNAITPFNFQINRNGDVFKWCSSPPFVFTRLYFHIDWR